MAALAHLNWHTVPLDESLTEVLNPVLVLKMEIPEAGCSPPVTHVAPDGAGRFLMPLWCSDFGATGCAPAVSDAQLWLWPLLATLLFL